jgi:MYXO-CTERM domain-containing protein
VDGIATLGSGCQGDGSCGPLLQQVCGPDGCDIGNVLCAKGCRADVDCTDPGQFCSGGVCVPKLGNGSACDAPSQCSTENCVDHFCCDTACNGQCESCNQAGAVGTCQAVVGVPRGSRPACPGAGACGGFCDGTSRTECALPGSSTTCGVPFCDNGATTGAPACANTVCVPPAPESCDPFACDPAGQECLTSCTRDEDCAPGLVCSNDGCVAKVTSGPDAGSDAGTDASTDASIGAGGAGGRAATDASIDGPRGTGGGAGRGGVSSGTGGSTSTDGGGIDGGAPKKGERGGATSDKGSCGCRVPGSGSSGGNAPLAVISVSLLLGLRRRRAPRLRPLA